MLAACAALPTARTAAVTRLRRFFYEVSHSGTSLKYQSKNGSIGKPEPWVPHILQIYIIFNQIEESEKFKF